MRTATEPDRADALALQTPTPEQEKRVVDMVLERYRVSAAFDRPFKDKALVAWKHLNNILPANWPFYSDFFEPETYIASNDTLEAIMQSVFGKGEYFDLVGTEGQDHVRAEKSKQLLKTAYHRAKYKVTKYFQMMEATHYGNGVEWHFANPSIRQVMRRAMGFDEFGLSLGVNSWREPVIEWWPSSKVLSRFDLYPAPTGASIQEMPYFIHRAIVPVDWLRAQTWHGYRHLDELEI